MIRAFRLTIEGLCGAVAARAARTPVAVPVFVLLWTRLRRLVVRFERLAARVSAGTLPPPSAPRPHRRRAPRPAAPVRLPQWFGWVIGPVPVAACYASQLQHLLAGPELAALLKAAPQAGRLLRPLCHMLGIETPTLLAAPVRPPRTPPTRVESPPAAPPERLPANPAPGPLPQDFGPA